MSKTKPPAKQGSSLPPDLPEAPLDRVVALANHVIAGTIANESDAIAELGACLKKDPGLFEVTGLFLMAWKSTIAGYCKDSLSTEVARREFAHIRRQLRGESPTPLEGILADRAALCWLQATLATSSVVQKLGAGSSIDSARFWHGVEDRAHHRFLAACKALAQVQRLQRPSAQVLVAQFQRERLREAGPAIPAETARAAGAEPLRR